MAVANRDRTRWAARARVRVRKMLEAIDQKRVAPGLATSVLCREFHSRFG